MLDRKATCDGAGGELSGERATLAWDPKVKAAPVEWTFERHAADRAVRNLTGVVAMKKDDMKSEKRAENITRYTILRLLSDEEIARVSTAETAERLADGDEYVDLEQPDRGVRRAEGVATAPMGDVLPRKAVRAHTWDQIVGLLSAHRAEAASRAN